MIDEHDRLEAQAAEIRARQKSRENSVPIRCLGQIRSLALSKDGYDWDLVIALVDEALRALAAATGTAKTPKAVECEASQSGHAVATPTPYRPKGTDK